MDSVRPLLAAQGLCLRWPDGLRALDGVDLTVDAGEIVAVVGASGCGKSTLLRLAAGLLEPSAGVIELDGRPPLRARQEGVGIGMVFQAATLLPWRNALDNVALPLELAGFGREPRQRRARALLERVGLGQFFATLPHQLSGGMQMRVALARALVAEPRLLLLDEPFAALDEITRQRLDEELVGLVASRGCGAIFVTHSVAEAVFVAARVVVLSPRPGRAVAELGVDLPPERVAALRSDPHFAHLCGVVSAALAAEAA